MAEREAVLLRLRNDVDFGHVRRLILIEVRLKAKIRFLENHYASTLEMIIDGFLPNSLHEDMLNVQVF